MDPFQIEFHDLQKKCVVSKKENVESLKKKIRFLEFKYLPKIIEKTILH